jgi:hypothetical protein
MWICPKCSEPHEDHFKICWRCASQEMQEHVTTEAPPPAKPEPRLRSVGSILVRAFIAFVVGAVIGGAISLTSPPDVQAVYAIYSGLALAIIVGIFFWVVLPYEPSSVAQTAKEEHPDADSLA